MEEAHFREPPTDLSLKSANVPPPDGLRLPTGSVRLVGGTQISALPGYDTGDWWVQDAAAALPARILKAQPDENVLDLCAAPGGKTMQLAATGARVTAVDSSSQRMARVEENLARTGLDADLQVLDGRQVSGRFDAILLDAPCSATGTIRRHPDLPHIKGDADVAGLVALQSELLDHAWTLLRPGGRLVFCTCSLLPEEGESQLARALHTLSDASADPDACLIEGIDPAWVTALGGLRLRPDYWPDHGGMDGFFVAALRKTAKAGD